MMTSIVNGRQLRKEVRSLKKEYNEVLIQAFISNYKVKDIAKAAGLTVSTINRYKNDPAFMAVLNERRSAIVNAAVDRMTESILNDVSVLQKIIDDDSVNAGIRVNAVNVKWLHLREWKSLVDFESRLRAIESAGIGFFERIQAGGEQK